MLAISEIKELHRIMNQISDLLDFNDNISPLVRDLLEKSYKAMENAEYRLEDLEEKYQELYNDYLNK